MSKAKSYVVISDTQTPFEDKKAMKAVVNFIGEYQPDEVVHIGDVVDFPQPSRWNKGTREEFEGSVFADAEYTIKNLIQPLREVYSGDIGFLEGNHDLRPRSYLDKYAPALSTSGAFNFETLLEFDNYEIRKLPSFYKFAPNWVMTHGHLGGISLSRIAGNTALNAAKKLGVSVIMGHCFDQETEILTPEGWVRHESLTTDSVVLTKNKETGALEWNKVNEVFRYTHFTELVHIKAQGLDLALTGGHGMLYHAPRDAFGAVQWKEATAEELYGEEIAVPTLDTSAPYVCVSKANWSRQPYSGVVWCVSVDNGTLVVRRNGKTAITQNTHRLGLGSHSVGYGGTVSQTLTGMEVGNLMDMKQAGYLKGAAGNWQQGFGLVHVDGKHVQATPIQISGKKFVVDGVTYNV